ncbi:MAG: hypothetical protein GKS02_09585 [Alphaproteobacteria bacterium]|nr:hypothetical protein [Alphaproteobacteria bacterium]
MGKPKTNQEPGSSLLSILETRYGLARTTIEKIGAFVVMWATFEGDLERALWQLTNEVPEGTVPTTDTKPVSRLIAMFREEGLKLEGGDWQRIVTLLCDTAKNLAEYRNALVHGRLLPTSVGGGLVLNAAWHGEQRTRDPVTAHIDDNLVGIMLDALQELLVLVRVIASGGTTPNTDPSVLERVPSLQHAYAGAGEVRFLTEAMNSEKY